MLIQENGTGAYPRSFTKNLERWSAREVVLSSTAVGDIVHCLSFNLRSLILDKRELHFLENLKREKNNL